MGRCLVMGQGTPMIRRLAFKKGDRVVRNKAVGGKLRGDMTGTVRRVTAVPHGSGGTRARVRVLWDNGHEGSLEDRQLLFIKGKP